MPPSPNPLSLTVRNNAFSNGNSTDAPAGAAHGPLSERGTTVQAVCLAIYSLTAVVVGLRAYVRGRMVKAVGLDDYFIAAGFIITGFNVALIIMQVQAGLGRHSTDQEHISIVTFMKTAWAYNIIYVLALWTVKMSILVLYKRLASTPRQRHVIHGVMAILTGYTIAITPAQIFQCRPFNRSYSPGFPEGCGNVNAMYLVQAMFNIISDVVILVLPIRVIGQLMVDKRKKVTLYTILLLGLFACIAAIVRLVELISFLKSSELLWSIAPTIMCSQLEICIGIITASLPSLQPLFKKLFEASRRVLTTATHSNGGTGYGLRNMSKTGTEYNVRVKGNANGLGMSRLGSGESEETIVTGKMEGTDGLGSRTDARGLKVEKTVEVRVDYD